MVVTPATRLPRSRAKSISVIEGMPETVARAPVHPAHPERGVRELRAGPGIPVFVGREDLPKEAGKVRLKDLCNIDYADGKMKYAGNDLSILKNGVPIIHWAPSNAVEAEVLMTDGTSKKGLAEPGLASAKDKVVQLERFAFVRVEATAPGIRCVFSHR